MKVVFNVHNRPTVLKYGSAVVSIFTTIFTLQSMYMKYASTVSAHTPAWSEHLKSKLSFGIYVLSHTPGHKTLLEGVCDEQTSLSPTKQSCFWSMFEESHVTS